MVKVEAIGNPTVLGEGPHWDEEHQVLYFVDILKSTVNKYDPATKTQTTVTVDGGAVSLVVPVEGKKDQFVITVGRSLAVMTWDGKSSKPTKVEVLSTVDEEDGKRDNRFNDGKVDPTGRLWAGTMGPESKPAEVEKYKGSLFSFSKAGKPTNQVKDISIANGLAWSSDTKTLYYIDSLNFGVEAFDFDADSGKLSNRRVVFDFKKNNIDAFPDGMTIDTEGNLWVACFKAALVIRVDPRSGKLLSSVSVPSPQTTSVVFGGPNLDELYITSANNSLSEEERKKYPLAGHTFHVTGVGARGLPMKNVHLA